MTLKINGQRVRHRAGGLSKNLPLVQSTDCRNSGTKSDTETGQRLSQCLHISGLKCFPGQMSTFFWGRKQPAWGSNLLIIHSGTCGRIYWKGNGERCIWEASSAQWVTKTQLDVIFPWSDHFILLPLHLELFRKKIATSSLHKEEDPAVITEFWTECHGNRILVSGLPLIHCDTVLGFVSSTAKWWDWTW